MPKYLTGGPIGYCQRCGMKYLHSELGPDGYKPEIMVCETCFEEDHPQLYPVYIPNDEGVLPYTLPPNETTHAYVNLGGHVQLTDLTVIEPAAFELLAGRVEVTV